jgi:hypothetical protein
MAGVGSSYGSAAPCAPYQNNGWDVMVGDFTAPTIQALNPVDEGHNANGDVVTITLTEDVAWAAGKSLADLVPGDIALYTSTDNILGEYGGDVIFHTPANVQIAGSVITITWPDVLPALTEVYVRVAEDLFVEGSDCCGSPLPWEGLNGNGRDHLLGDNGDWNFTTKDNNAPGVNIDYNTCDGAKLPMDAVFTITIDEVNLVVANTLVALSNANVNNFISFDDGNNGTATATVAEVGGNTVITVTPNGNLPSDKQVTVGLTSGLWDNSHNDVPATSTTATTGDFTAPDVSSVASANWDGTSFDLTGNIPEDATLYYIVQLKSITVNPSAKQIFDIATGLATSYTVGSVTVDADFAPGNNEEIWAAGSFAVNAGIPFLQRITNLDATHGTEFDVFFIGINHSACGPYNLGSITGKDLPAVGGWVTNVTPIDAHILDILPPEATYGAHRYNGNEVIPTTCPGGGISRDGALIVRFNEGIRLADGNPITPESLEDIFTLNEDTGSGFVEVGIDTDKSYYNASSRKIYIYPDSSFKSGSTVELSLGGNKIEDIEENPVKFGGGVEQNNMSSNTYCVETYCPPVLAWYADKWAGLGDTTLNSRIYDCTPATMYDPITKAPEGQVITTSDITIRAGQKLYIPADDEANPGILEAVTNDNVSKYVKIRVGPNPLSATACDDARVGLIIYEEGNVVDFNITINGAGNTIAIEPANGFEFESETYYNIEIEGQLQNADRQTLADAVGMPCGAVDEFNNLSFLTSDAVAPEAFFFEADATDPDPATSFSDEIPDCTDPVEVVNLEDRIGVRVTEWVEIGFDGFKELEPTDVIEDANALRRYISLTGPSGIIKFDVEDFSVDATTDEATFFIDPYDYPNAGDEAPNWVKGEKYEICFISNPDEYQEGGDPYGPGALRDDHGNFVPVKCACFEADPETVVNPECLPVVAFGPDVCNGVTADSTELVVTLTFERAMYLNQSLTTVPSGNQLTPMIALVRPGATEATQLDHILGVATIDPSAMASTDGKVWTWNLTNTPIEVAYNAGNYSVGDEFELWITQQAFVPVAGGCAAWPATATNVLLPVGDGPQLVTTNEDFTVGDDVGPSIVSTSPDLSVDCSSANELASITSNIVLTWDENVVAVDGQVFEIFEFGTNTLIASINIKNCDISNNVVTIPNGFSNLLEYNTCYYIHFNQGIVTDECGNPTEEYALDDATMNFSVGADPRPEIIACGNDPYNPDHGSTITEVQPLMSVEFTEPVQPVAGKYIEVYELGSATSLFFQFDVSHMTAKAGSNNKIWQIQSADIFALAGVNPNQFAWGDCYEVNIDTLAFVELSGSGQATDKVVTQITAAEPTTHGCPWSFCIGDNVPPTVKWWPEDTSPEQIQIPTNAHLYAYISEAVVINGNTLALTPENAKPYFKLSKSISATGPWTELTAPNDFVLEFVDNDKQKVRITPQDAAAPDVQVASMEAETWYKLEVSADAFTTTTDTLEDVNGNAVVSSETIFQTEDLTCPTIETLTVSSVDEDEISIHVDLNEKGAFYYVVLRAGVAQLSFETVKNAGGVNLGVASGYLETDAAGVEDFNVTGLDGNDADGYDFVVYIYPQDDEIDRWPSTSAVAEWSEMPWPYSAEYDIIDQNEPQWVYDIHKAPNWCETSVDSEGVTICDNDVPEIIGSYPAFPDPLFNSGVAATTNVAVDAVFFLEFNENIQMYLDAAGTELDDHDRLVLRDHENNIAIPLDISIVAGTAGDASRIEFYPLDPELTVPWTLDGAGTAVDLLEQHRYYIEWERYAISDEDDTWCNPNNGNFIEELIGKDWWFKTKDDTPPVVICPGTPKGSCVGDKANVTITVTDGNSVSINPAISGDNAFVYIYEDGTIIPQERIHLAQGYISSRSVNGAGDSVFVWTFPTAYFYLSNTCYNVSVPANLFVDSYGNISDNDECEWQFCTADYEAPIASTDLYEDYSYLFDVLYSEPDYQVNVTEDNEAGSVFTDISTSAFFRINFNEPVKIRKPSGAWRALSDLNVSGLSYQDVSSILVVKNETDGRELVWNEDYVIEKADDWWSPSRDETMFKVIIIEDQSHYGYGGPIEGKHPYSLGSMKSESTYSISILANKVADLVNCPPYNPNIMGAVEPLITVTTRDDSPPQLSMYDAENNLICDTTCAGTDGYANQYQPVIFHMFNFDFQIVDEWWDSYYIGYPEWPGSEFPFSDAKICNYCVAEGEYIELKFDKPIVKTPGDIAALWPFGDGGVNWWTEANLGLKEKDFIPVEGQINEYDGLSDYFRMAKIGSMSEENCKGSTAPGFGGFKFVSFDHVEIIGDSIFRLYFLDGELESQGIYRATFAPYMVKDQVRIPDGNEFLGLTCTFVVRDHSAPEVCQVAEQVSGTFSWHDTFIEDPGRPDPNGNIERDTTTNLAIQFNEPVNISDDKKIIIRSRNGQQRDTISSADIEYFDAVGHPMYQRRVLIPLNNNLKEFTQYYIDIEEGFVNDTAYNACKPYPSNSYRGMDSELDNPFRVTYGNVGSPAFEWSFTTGDMTPPTALKYYPNHTNCVPKNTKLSIKMDENIFDDKCSPAPDASALTSSGIYIYADNGAVPGYDFGNFVEFVPWNSPAIEISGTDVNNGLTSDSITIKPELIDNGGWVTNMRYYIRLTDDMWCDGANNFYGGVKDTTTWEFTIANDIPPVLTQVTPKHDVEAAVVCNDPQIVVDEHGFAKVDLIMTFEDENGDPLEVAPGSGQLKIFEYIYQPNTFAWEEKLWKSIDVSELTFAGNQVSILDVPVRDDINRSNTCGEERNYYVTVDPGVVTNGICGSLTYWDGIDNAFEWRFQTCADNIFVDGGKPVSPLGSDIELPKDAPLDLVMDFSEAEAIEAIPGTGARIKIHLASDSSIVDELLVLPGNIENNEILTVATTELSEQTAYFVTIDEGAFGDTSTCSTPFPGWDDATTWTFETGDYTAPVPVWQVPDNDNCVEPCITVKWVFENESGPNNVGVDVSTGMVNLHRVVGIDTILVTSLPVVLDPEDATGKTIMVDLCSANVELTDFTEYFFTMDEGTVVDKSGHSLVNAAYGLDAGWRLFVQDNTDPVIVSVLPNGDNEENNTTISIEIDETVKPTDSLITVTSASGTFTFKASDMDRDGIDGNVAHDTLFTYDLVGLDDNTEYTVSVPEGAFEDYACRLSGFNSTAVAETKFTVGDHVAPEIVSVVPDATVTDPNDAPSTFTVDITFSEEVINTEVGITINGEAATDVTNDGNVYTVTLTGNDNETLTLAVTDDITDPSINANVLTNPGSWTYNIGDNTPPSVIVDSPGASDTINVFDVTITFSEVVTGVDISSVTVSGVLATAPTMTLDTLVEGLSYEATISAADGDTVTLALSDAIVDAAGNSLAPSTYEYTIFNEAPTYTVNPEEGVNLENGPVEVMVTFSEPVVNAETGIVVNGATGTPSVEKVDDTNYKVTFEGDEKTTVTVEVTDAITDVVGAPVVAETFTYVYDDNTAPTVVSVVPESDNSAPNTFVVVVTFSEPVYGVADGITAVGGTGTSVTKGVDGDTEYEVTITGNDEDDVTMTIGTSIVDGAGNPNPLAEESKYYYTIGDNTAPTLEFTTLEDPQANTFDIMLTFNEPVNGVESALSVENGTINDVDGKDGDTKYIVNITAEDLAKVTLTVGKEVTDIAGNEFAGAAVVVNVGDWTAPVATAMTPTGLLDEDDTTFDLVLTLDEDVVAGSGKVTVNEEDGTTAASFDISEVIVYGNTVTVPVSLNKYTKYYVLVEEGFVEDASGNEFAGIADATTWEFETKGFATGVDPIDDIEFKVYPNPFSNYINIDNASKLERVVISNITGQTMIDVVNPERVIRTPNLVSGVYVISLFDENGIVKTERIVKR